MSVASDMTTETMTAGDLTITLLVDIDADTARAMNEFAGTNVLSLTVEQTALCEFQTRPSHKRSTEAKVRVKAVLKAARAAAKRLGAPVRIVGVVDLLPMYGGRQHSVLDQVG
jgi:hypothetical protein